MRAPEVFPARVDFETANTRKEYQAYVPSCTAFGLTSALEVLADRAGAPIQLSSRYVYWWETKNGTGALSVDASVAAVNKMGVCADALCPYIIDRNYPLGVKDIDTAPDFAAIADAQTRGIKNIKTREIYGREEAMRALCNGSPLITVRTLPGGGDHCECCIGYDDALGLKILGSGNEIYWESWASLSKIIITQLHMIVSAPWPLVPHPDYDMGAIPTWNGERLHIPLVDITQPYPTKWMRFGAVDVAFENLGDVSKDDGITFNRPRWQSDQKCLFLPVVDVGGTLVKNIKLANPMMRILAAQQED